MIEFGKDHSPAWLELMSAYQIFRARLFDWSREPDQVKQRDLLLEERWWRIFYAAPRCGMKKPSSWFRKN